VSEAVPAPRPPEGYACPRCGKAVGPREPWRPFCCERCKNVDLGAWLLGHYRVPAAEVPDEAPKGGPLPLAPAPDDDDDAR
jgi:endogenous inhibitor of DNA gyrase (YacG/DUF329 family)